MSNVGAHLGYLMGPRSGSRDMAGPGPHLRLIGHWSVQTSVPPDLQKTHWRGRGREARPAPGQPLSFLTPPGRGNRPCGCHSAGSEVHRAPADHSHPPTLPASHVGQRLQPCSPWGLLLPRSATSRNFGSRLGAANIHHDLQPKDSEPCPHSSLQGRGGDTLSRNRAQREPRCRVGVGTGARAHEGSLP